jgi:kinetochore protein Spc7/SPC105
LQPPISIEQFFAMTEIKFMDDLTCPRRSTIHPSQFDRRHSVGKNVEDISLAEYLTAVTVDIPELELLSWVTADLTAWTEQSKKNFLECEESVAQVTPGLFREYSLANDAGRAELQVCYSLTTFFHNILTSLQYQLKLIKSNYHGVSRAKWYDYKLKWIQNLSGEAQRGFEALEKVRFTVVFLWSLEGWRIATQDALFIEEELKLVQDVLPRLSEQYEQIMHELEKERQEVAELEESDQDYLNELKATIAEQKWVSWVKVVPYINILRPYIWQWGAGDLPCRGSRG